MKIRLERLKIGSLFQGLISCCFEPHINVYMETRSKELSQMMDKFAKEAEQMLPPKVSVLTGMNALQSH